MAATIIFSSNVPFLKSEMDRVITGLQDTWETGLKESVQFWMAGGYSVPHHHVRSGGYGPEIYDTGALYDSIGTYSTAMAGYYDTYVGTDVSYASYVEDGATVEARPFIEDGAQYYCYDIEKDLTAALQSVFA